MKTTDAERMVQSVLQQNAEQQNQTATRLGAAIATSQREATEVTRLEAARRERIEAESISRIATAQANALKQRQQLEHPSSVRAQDIRPVESIERPVVTELPRQREATRQAFVMQPQPNRDGAKYVGGVERSDQSATATASLERSPLEVQVKANRELIVKLEDDSQAFVDAVVKQVEILMEERDLLILQQVEQRLIDSQSRRQNALNFTS